MNAFDPAAAYDAIKTHWTEFMKRVGMNKVVIGVSGGKDSTVELKLAADFFGPENTIGVMMPNGLQADISDSMDAIAFAKVKSYAVNIKTAYDGLLDQLRYNGMTPSDDTKINLPPRLRMSALFAIGQTERAVVICSDNLSELMTGYSTFGGDGFGSYAPLKGMTATEVVKLGEWLKISDRLIHKVPSDGLCGSTDEMKMGFTYAVLDRYIRTGEIDDLGAKTLIDRRFAANKFKLEIVNVPGPDLGLPNFFITNLSRKGNHLQ